MNKSLIFSLSLIFSAFLAIKPMEAPEETQKPTKMDIEEPKNIEKFEQFQQLSEDMQKEVLLQFLYSTAQNDSLEFAVENIKNAVLVSKLWEKIINTEEVTNQLVDMMLKNPKISKLLNEIAFVKGFRTIRDKIKKNLLLIVLGTKTAQRLLLKVDIIPIFQAMFENITNRIDSSVVTPDLFYLLSNFFKYLNSINAPIDAISLGVLLKILNQKSSENVRVEFKNFLKSIENLKIITPLKKREVLKEFFN